MLLAEIKELGSANSSEVVALAGLAPMNRDPGMMRGRKTIRGGRVMARNTLYMASVSAVRGNRDLEAFYERLRQAGRQAIQGCNHGRQAKASDPCKHLAKGGQGLVGNPALNRPLAARYLGVTSANEAVIAARVTRALAFAREAMRLC